MTQTEQSKAGMQARREAEQQLFEEYPERLRELIDEAYAKRGLTYKPKLTREERAKKQADEKRAKAEARELAKRKKAIAEIRETAVKNGLPDPYTDAEAAVLANRQVTEAIIATHEGTAEGVTLDREALSAETRAKAEEIAAEAEEYEERIRAEDARVEATTERVSQRLHNGEGETAEEFEQRLRNGDVHPLE